MCLAGSRSELHRLDEVSHFLCQGPVYHNCQGQQLCERAVTSRATCLSLLAASQEQGLQLNFHFPDAGQVLRLETAAALGIGFLTPLHSCNWLRCTAWHP